MFHIRTHHNLLTTSGLAGVQGRINACGGCWNPHAISLGLRALRILGHILDPIQHHSKTTHSTSSEGSCTQRRSSFRRPASKDSSVGDAAPAPQLWSSCEIEKLQRPCPKNHLVSFCSATGNTFFVFLHLTHCTTIGNHKYHLWFQAFWQAQTFQEFPFKLWKT